MGPRSVLVTAAVALWTLLGAAALYAHSGHLYPSYKNAVDDAAHELRYVDKTAYNDALLHARQAWNNVRTLNRNPLVKVRQSGETATLEVLDVHWTTVDTLGQWFYNSNKPSKVKLNCDWLGSPGRCEDPKKNLSTYKEGIVVAHEFGHTLGLYHMMYDQLMDETPIHSDPVTVNTPQAHDKLHYHDRWD